MGNLFLAEKEGANEFTLDDQRVVEVLAQRAGVAIETARLFRAESSGRTWLHTVIDQMPEGVIVLDARGEIAHINRTAKAFLRPAAFTETFGFEVCWPSGAPIAQAELPIVRALRSRETVTGVEMLLRNPDGRLVPVLVNASPIEEGEPAVGGAIAVFQDISVIKQLERMREEWTSVVAHDLRQPIGVIKLATEFLSSLELDDDDARSVVARIDRASSGLERMIGDLLDASRIESRRLTVQTQRLDARAILPDLAEQMVIRGSLVDLRIAEDLPDLDADSGRLSQIVTNLLTNAAKYGEPKAPILLSAKRLEEHVEIAVTNRGRGLTHEEIASVFDRYYRTRSASKSREGLGLGLYIVKGLVEAHGGWVEVDSVPGETTTFRFTLPIYRGARAKTSSPPPPMTTAP